MYKIEYIGSWKSIPEAAAAIYDSDIPKLEAMLQNGLNLNVPIQFSEHIKLMPLEIAVFQNNVPMIHFLLEHGADSDLAEEGPILLTAVRCCKPDVVMLFAKQVAKLSSDKKRRAFEEVRWGNRPENIPVLEQIGITVAEFGGDAFRSAVSDGNRELAQLLLEKGADIDYHKPDMVFPYASTPVTEQLLLEKGADIDYHKPDMVFPYASTPVTEAARSNDFDMVRWLVENGADIKIADKYGDRPYTIAVQNKNQEMADYLKALEPEEWHNEQEKIRQLKPYKLPVQLTEYLKKGPLRLEFPEQELVKWVELYSYMDIQEMKWQRKKYLSLMVQMDNYSDYMLLWNAKDKKIWYLDIGTNLLQPPELISME